MELIITIIGIGISLILNIIAIMIYHSFTERTLSSVRRMGMHLTSLIGEQEKKTRKAKKKGPVPPSKKSGSELRFG